MANDKLTALHAHHAINERRQQIKDAALAKYDEDTPKRVVKPIVNVAVKAAKRPPDDKNDGKQLGLADIAPVFKMRTHYDQSEMPQCKDEDIKWTDTTNNYRHLF
ncbi:hypothetical protein [Moritella viscosa]|uniref:Protein serine/threonine phosphatase n=1 Tax=Moritella viscosa TaxID=80854 RepID=A0A1L0AME6_9GAMM|nr:hypothetical protein [Moritella viscosa]SGZ17418.1 Protein serine/threonine phosphatase [Moritella viscosa]